MRRQSAFLIACLALLSCDENRLDIVRSSGAPAISLSARAVGYDAAVDEFGEIVRKRFSCFGLVRGKAQRRGETFGTV